ncbi:hypothetical protein D3H35_13200 [Cohnella faecalis]|uniref:Uncharacterized protein n=2 Tax=Cohnella faecalis TaxID=2315694 RepID=A0A398CS39_9BACL|nr:hypothetical protein D3H35_13200 [Cohnella faecalis]
MSFDVERFADLLKSAKGNRSINKYAQDIDISAAHISRLIRGLIGTPPSPETINKFAQGAHNGVSYNELMMAAGHIGKANVNEDGNADRETGSRLEKEFLHILLSELYQQDYEWSFEKSRGARFTPDFTIKLNNADYTVWHIELKSSTVIKDPYLYRLYGTIATLEMSPSVKFTIAVESLEAYNYIKDFPPVSLRANLFVMLVDFQKKAIVNEERLCRY